MPGAGDLPGRVLPLALRQAGPSGGGEPEDRRPGGADPRREPGQGLTPHPGRPGTVPPDAHQRQAGAAHLPQPGHPLHNQVRRQGLHQGEPHTPAHSGEPAGPGLPRGQAQREMAHQRHGVPLPCGLLCAEALLERHSGSVRLSYRGVRHPGYQRHRPGPRYPGPSHCRKSQRPSPLSQRPGLPVHHKDLP